MTMINDHDMVSMPLLDMRWTSQSIITNKLNYVLYVLNIDNSTYEIL